MKESAPAPQSDSTRRSWRERPTGRDAVYGIGFAPVLLTTAANRSNASALESTDTTEHGCCPTDLGQ